MRFMFFAVFVLLATVGFVMGAGHMSDGHYILGAVWLAGGVFSAFNAADVLGSF